MTEIISSLEADQKDILTYSGADQMVHFRDYLLSKEAQALQSKPLHCDFVSFNEKIAGLETGEVVVITGYTKNGKTLFAESWIHSMARKDPNSRAAYFSFEVQTEKILQKYNYDFNLPLFVPMELRTMDFDWLKERCLEAKLKHECKIILIDHLHFLVDMNTKQNMSLNIGAFMRKLKHEIAIGLNLAVILIAHQGQPKEGQDASLGGIRDSSFISQEADAVIIVSRRKNMDDVEISDFKDKFGIEKAERVLAPPLIEDDFSAGLAIVKIAVSRRTGIYDYKKLFRKFGDFLVEV